MSGSSLHWNYLFGVPRKTRRVCAEGSMVQAVLTPPTGSSLILSFYNPNTKLKS